MALPFQDPGLEVLVNHGEEKVSLAFAELIRQRLPIKATVPQWREKRTFFGPERLETPQAAASVREREDFFPPSQESLSVLFRHLDRNYKKLRHRIRRKLSADKTLQDPDWMNRLEEINEKVKDLERER
jgi:hypothetical protein